VADLTPEDPDEGPTPPTRRERRRGESAAAGTTPAGGAAEDAAGADDTPENGNLPENDDILEDPDGDGAATAAPVIVRPSSRKGYQTVTVNRNRTLDAEALAKREARRKRRRRRNIVLISAFGAFVVLVAGLSLAVRGLLPRLDSQDYPGPGGDPVTFTVNAGEGALAIGGRLTDEDIVASSGAFIEAVNQSRSENSIQPGDYEMRRQMKAADAAAVLLREGQEQVHYVAVNRGMRVNEAIEAISTSTGLSMSELEAAAEDPTAYGLPDQAVSLEGYLAPGEYRFPLDAAPEDIFTLMVDKTFERLEDLGVTDPDEQYRTVTIASILEAEALTDDYPVVAGIIENRLAPENPETGGFLQIDATVIYGLGQRQLQFTPEQKRDAGNPYNTYVHRGLPPGPIGAPSLPALDAAANPQDSDFYYWVTTNIATGETKFAKDYAQHRVYQQEYRDYCAENAEICG
jgi:UPF0755 protein